MITLENLAAFVFGMAVVYMMFRGAGFFVVLFFLTLATRIEAQSVAVTNWPDATAPLAVQATTDVWPSAAAGFGFGLTVCGYGLIFRNAKRTANDC